MLCTLLGVTDRGWFGAVWPNQIIDDMRVGTLSTKGAAVSILDVSTIEAMCSLWPTWGASLSDRHYAPCTGCGLQRPCSDTPACKPCV